MLAVGQSPLKMVENQQILVTSAYSDSFDKLKGKVVSNLQANMDVEMPKGVMEMAEKQQFNVFDSSVYSDKSKGQPMDIEMNQDVDKHIHAGFQFIAT